MVRLIHLNGPPGIGKSTIASAFADRHPGVLNLDIDRVAAMIGGCSENFSVSLDAGRLLAAGMARAHLASGHDVIMPQMMTHVNAIELADFEAAAATAEAEYLQILLTANVELSVERCMERSKAGTPQDVVSKAIDDRGGRDFVRKLHAQVTQFSADRQPHAVIDCERLTIEQTCQAVETAVGQPHRRRARVRRASPTAALQLARLTSPRRLCVVTHGQGLDAGELRRRWSADPRRRADRLQQERRLLGCTGQRGGLRSHEGPGCRIAAYGTASVRSVSVSCRAPLTASARPSRAAVTIAVRCPTAATCRLVRPAKMWLTKTRAAKMTSAVTRVSQLPNMTATTIAETTT